MKTPKPGQIFKFNGTLYRARKRINGCRGCVLDNPILCPNIVDSRNGQKTLDCVGNNIILKRS